MAQPQYTPDMSRLNKDAGAIRQRMMGILEGPTFESPQAMAGVGAQAAPPQAPAGPVLYGAPGDPWVYEVAGDTIRVSQAGSQPLEVQPGTPAYTAIKAQLDSGALQPGQGAAAEGGQPTAPAVPTPAPSVPAPAPAMPSPEPGAPPAPGTPQAGFEQWAAAQQAQAQQALTPEAVLSDALRQGRRFTTGQDVQGALESAQPGMPSPEAQAQGRDQFEAWAAAQQVPPGESAQPVPWSPAYEFQMHQRGLQETPQADALARSQEALMAGLERRGAERRRDEFLARHQAPGLPGLPSIPGLGGSAASLDGAPAPQYPFRELVKTIIREVQAETDKGVGKARKALTGSE